MLCNNTFYNICVILSEQNHPLISELVKSAIKIYETNNMFKEIELFKYHLLIINELEKTNNDNNNNDLLINGAVHILLAFDSLSNESIRNLTELNQPVLAKAKVFNNLKASTYKSCIELTETLLNPKNYFLEQLKQLLQQCLGRFEISEVQPPEYRAKMYLIQAMIFKLENNFVESLRSAHNAILSHPYDAVMDGLILFINHSNFHSTIRQSLINDIRRDSLNLADITPPTQIKNMNFLKRTERLIMLKKYERAIVKRLTDNNPVQAAYSYIDLVMATSGVSMHFPTSLTMSCLYFYKAMMNPACTSAELYAYRSIIFDLAIEIFLFTRHYLSLYMQMYIYKLLYTLILRSTDLFAQRIVITAQKPRSEDEFIINDFNETVLDELLKSMLQISKVNPLTHVPRTSLIHDMIYMECASNEFLSKYLRLMASRSSMHQYYFFEGIWKSWIDGENFDYERDKCMQYLLNDRNWTIYDVEDLLCWSLIPRTNDGWLLSTRHQLQLEQPAYSQVIGITLNNDTGDIEFMFTKARKTEHYLFDAEDIIDILTNGIDFAYFTLDPSSIEYHSHPFNEMKYLPKRLVNTPNYLLTLLHTDYLLKMISTGVEICSQAPFEMRPSSENLMQRLPTHIREELQSVVAKKSGFLTDSIHRFWIQPDSAVEYEQTFYRNFFGRTNENIIQFHLGDKLKMCVKKHRMKYDEKGNLIDDKTDDENDQSAEAEFARVFTKHYDEIGEYFPELLRLKELLKLGILSRIIQARYASQCDLATRIENDTTLDSYLTDIKKKIGRYPTGSAEADEKILTTISNILFKQFFCKTNDVKPYILRWLKYNQQHALSKYVKKSLIKQKAKLKFTVEKLNFNYDTTHKDDQMNNDSTLCFWVPAAFSSDLNIKVYGGVVMVAQPEETPGTRRAQEESKKSKETVNAKSLSEDATKKRGKQKNVFGKKRNLANRCPRCKSFYF